MSGNEGKKPKIAVVHDHLGWQGGGERTALTIALSLGADFICAYSNSKTYPEYQAALGSRLKVLSRKVKVIDRIMLRFVWSRFVFWHHRDLIREYDVIIASGQAATEAVANLSRIDATRIVYLHTPPRAIYDLYDENRDRYPRILHPAFAVFAWVWRRLFKRAMLRLDYIIANSENIRARLRRFTSHEANEVLWPPIDTERFAWSSQGDYFLSWARVDKNKRVDRIVEAFKKMPNEKLIVASGGPMLEEVRRMAAGHDNIRVVGWQTDAQLISLVGACRAAIYIPQDEDAGMTHLEANAAGKPVLGVAEGGLAESIVAGETGIALLANPSVEDIIGGVRKMTAQWCLSKRETCEAHARNFALEKFAERFQEIVDENDPRLPVVGIDVSRWSDPRRPGEGVGTGVEAYVRGLVTALLGEFKDKARVRLYAPALIDRVSPKYQKIIPGFRAWTLRHLNRELKLRPPFAFFTPGYFIPRNAPKRSFATVHDVLFLREPRKYSGRERMWQRLVTLWNVRRSRRIFTVSEASRDDIMRYYGVLERRISITPIAHERWQDINRERRREPLIVYIGRIEKKKSVDVLVRAFTVLARIRHDVRLVMIGSRGFGADAIDQLVRHSSAAGRIELVGFVSEERKKGLLTRAMVMVHPSTSEGSSIPLLEAWDAETPAVISDAPVMLNLAGSAAHVFHAGDERHLAEKIMEVLTQPQLREELVEKGRKRLDDFSWERSARVVATAIMEE